MRLFELNSKMIIADRGTYDLYTIKSKILDNLKTLRMRTATKDDVIYFDFLNFNISSGHQIPGYLVLRFFHEGKIIIDKQPDSIFITWFVKLGSLYFSSFCFTLLVALLTWLSDDLNIISSIVIPIFFFLFYIFIGILAIRYKIKNIIYKSVYYDRI